MERLWDGWIRYVILFFGGRALMSRVLTGSTGQSHDVLAGGGLHTRPARSHVAPMRSAPTEGKTRWEIRRDQTGTAYLRPKY